MLDIHRVMKSLSERRPIFHSEADFQFALAWQIKEANADSEIRLEFKPFPCEYSRMELDIWIPSEGTVIELKYPRTFLEVLFNGEQFVLKEGADDTDRRDFVKDIARIEQVIDKRSDADRGFAVLLTNLRRLWKPPTGSWRTHQDAMFRIHECHQLAGELDWKPGTPDGTKGADKDPIKLNGRYTMCWQDYSDLDTRKNSRFRYLAVEVGG